jgi:hypothetical protein
MDGAIRASPAEWDFWFEPGDLASLGLLQDAWPGEAPGRDYTAQIQAAADTFAHGT